MIAIDLNKQQALHSMPIQSNTTHFYYTGDILYNKGIFINRG